MFWICYFMLFHCITCFPFVNKNWTTLFWVEDVFIPLVDKFLIWWLTWMWTFYPRELFYVYWIKSLQLIFYFHVWYYINIYVGVEGVTRYTWTCNDGMWCCEMLNHGHRIWLWIIVWLILDVIILVLWIENYAITWLVFTLRKVLMRKGLKGKCRVPS